MTFSYLSVSPLSHVALRKGLTLARRQIYWLFYSFNLKNASVIKILLLCTVVSRKDYPDVVQAEERPSDVCNH